MVIFTCLMFLLLMTVEVFAQPKAIPQRDIIELDLAPKESVEHQKHSPQQVVPQQAPGTRITFFEGTPPTMKLVPKAEGPLKRGGKMQYSLTFSEVPKPINMFSLRIDYTTPSLTFGGIVRQGNGYQVVVSDPYQWREDFASISMAGIALDGITQGELAIIEFDVKADAKETGTIELDDHPMIIEKLAHDENMNTIEFGRVFDNSKTQDIAIVDAGEEGLTEFETPAPRVLFQRQKPTINEPEP